MPGFFLSLGGACSNPPSGRKTPDKARAFFGLRFLFSTFHPPAGRISLPAGQFHRAKRDFTRPQDGFHCREPGASGSASLSRARIPKRSSGPFLGPRRAGGSRSETEGVFVSFPLSEQKRAGARRLPVLRDRFFFSVSLSVFSFSRRGGRRRGKEPPRGGGN